MDLLFSYVSLYENRDNLYGMNYQTLKDDELVTASEEIIPNTHVLEDVIVPPYLPNTPEVRKDFVHYYNEITRLDKYVGDVVAELDRQGISDNTLILFISDNGRTFPRDKTTLYDGGIKTPWIVKWPSKVKPESVCSSLISAVDIAPTFLKLACLKSLPQFEGVRFFSFINKPQKKSKRYNLC